MTGASASSANGSGGRLKGAAMECSLIRLLGKARRAQCAHRAPTDAAALPARGGRAKSVAVELLHALPALLRLERQRGGGTREQSRDADGLARLLAITVAAVLDHAQRLFDFLEKLPFTVACAQLEGVFLFERGAVRRIGGDL